MKNLNKINFFKNKYPILFCRIDKLTTKELLINIIQLENRKALADFVKHFGIDFTKELFLKIKDSFVTNPDMYGRWQRMYNFFIVYSRKLKGKIRDMRKYSFWRNKYI